MEETSSSLSQYMNAVRAPRLCSIRGMRSCIQCVLEGGERAAVSGPARAHKLIARGSSMSTESGSSTGIHLILIWKDRWACIELGSDDEDEESGMMNECLYMEIYRRLLITIINNNR